MRSEVCSLPFFLNTLLMNEDKLTSPDVLLEEFILSSSLNHRL